MNRASTKRDRSGLRAAYYLFLTVGMIALGYVGYSVLTRYWYQDQETVKFETVNTPVAEQRPVQSEAVPDGETIGEIEAPRLGLKSIVVQGDSANLLRLAVGHIPETALPGEDGNIALAGHRDGIFRPLRDVQRGDAIILRTQRREFQYKVDWTAVVPPTAVSVIQPTSEPALTLVTCFPFHYFGAAPERFIVRAREVAVVSRALNTGPAPSERPTILEVSERTIVYDRVQKLFTKSVREVERLGAKESSNLLAVLTSNAYEHVVPSVRDRSHSAWARLQRAIKTIITLNIENDASISWHS